MSRIDLSSNMTVTTAIATTAKNPINFSLHVARLAKSHQRRIAMLRIAGPRKAAINIGKVGDSTRPGMKRIANIDTTSKSAGHHRIDCHLFDCEAFDFELCSDWFSSEESLTSVK